jgi:RNA polymerase sigma-70 factor (ECF subfamily)
MAARDRAVRDRADRDMANNDNPSPKHHRLSEAERAERLTQLVLRRSQLTSEEEALLREIFPALMEAHLDTVWERLRRRGLQVADVEDLTQEVFLTLYPHLVANGFPDNLDAWLQTVAVGKLLNHLRKKRRDPASVGLPSSGSEPPRSPPQHERTMDRRKAVLEVLPQLSSDHQAVVALVILHGLSHIAAAEMLGIPEGTLKSRLIAAKRRLAQLLGPLLPPSEKEPA